ncbi:lipopolysaccharide biosynthesis protein [Salipiger abyssi]|uniref:lipopolysaccharide biosynthesis protein n=1 Tax=Salipiger abyssi TaxID=1250539 RepID=UPI001A8C294D|nr:lipopolysaccharide biosynthesis protein [Salipiger abyssi]MBN9890475.1 lipopolysaccharide biosynthesis protein [Salipiger abyssi]
MGDIRTRLLKGALWIAVGRLVANALGFVSTLLLARLLVPEDFGLVAICTAFMAILLAITEMPLAEALIQHDDPQDAHFHTAFSMSAVRGAVMGGLLAVFAGPVAGFYGDPRLRDILYVMAGGVFAVSLSNPKIVTFQRELEFRQVFVMQISEKVLSFLVAIAVAVLFRSYWALVLGGLAAELTRVALSYGLRPFRPRPTFVHWRELLSFSIWLTFANCIQAMNWRANPLVYGAILPTHLMGQYSFGNRVTNVLFGQLAQPVQQTLYPAFSRFKHNLPELRRAYVRAQGIMCMWIFPCAIGFAALAPDFVELIVGEKWLEAVPVIQLQAISSALQAAVAIQPLAMGTGNTKRLFHRDLRAFLVRWPLVLLAIWLAWPHGAYAILIGAMLGALAASVVNVIWNMTLVRAIAELPLRAQMTFALRPFLAVVTMTAAIWLAGLLMPASTSIAAAWLRLLVLCLVGAFSYAGALAILWLASGRPDAAEVEVVQLLRGAFRKLRSRAGY